ncbi:hypothetical protein N303_05571, partial [Cuculus canorus]
LFGIVWGDPELLICPGRRIGIWEMALPHQHHVRVVPEVPEDPEPHEAAEELTADHLGARQLRELPVPRVDVHPTTR